METLPTPNLPETDFAIPDFEIANFTDLWDKRLWEFVSFE